MSIPIGVHRSETIPSFPLRSKEGKSGLNVEEIHRTHSQDQYV
ncbi:MAG TPA: hypothetical protein VJ909_08215 [Prolixibacteraceae bacterium]|nr:hypothetical protein [Prolixibacteraceae bacterium]